MFFLLQELISEFLFAACFGAEDTNAFTTKR